MSAQNIAREAALSLVGSPYVWGGTGDKCTVANRAKRVKQYPNQADGIIAYCPALKAGQDKCVPRCKNIGKRIVDCAQLVRISLKAAGIALPSGASSQWKRGAWARKGTISDMPMDTVCAVFRETKSGNPMGHVGLYLGDGTVVDARGARYGVLHKPLSAYPWTHYAVPNWDGAAPTPTVPADAPAQAFTPQMNNTSPAAQNAHTGQISANMGMPTLRYGHRGADVQRMQELLALAGHDIKADGIFGKQTLATVKAFQASDGLKPDGIVGRLTWTALKGGE